MFSGAVILMNYTEFTSEFQQKVFSGRLFRQRNSHCDPKLGPSGPGQEGFPIECANSVSNRV